MPRFFGRLLAGLSIQSKILTFIVPISLLVVAIAAVSVLTGNMIGKQLKGAGESIAALSSFKKTYSEMNEFLANTSEDRRNQLVVNLKARSDEMGAALATDTDPDAADMLRQTKDVVDRMIPRVDELWKLQQTEMAISTKMRENTDNLTSVRDKMQALFDQVQLSLRSQDMEAKSFIHKADLLSKSAEVVVTILTRIGNSPETQTLGETIEQFKAQMMDAAANIQGFLPASQMSAGTPVRDGFNKILELTAKGEIDQDKYQQIEQIAGDLRPVAYRLRGLSTSMSQVSTKKFGELEKPVAEAARISDYTTDVRMAVNDVVLNTVGLLGERDDAHLKTLQSSLDHLFSIAGDVPKVSNETQLAGFGKGILDAGKSISTQAADLVKAEQQRSNSFAQTSADIDSTWMKIVGFADRQRDVAGHAAGKAMTISVSVAAAAVVLSVLATLALVGALKGPIRLLTQTMKDVASGMLDTDVAGLDRRDEIGDMARALGVFKANAQDKVRVETEAGETRRRAETERQTADREREEAAHALRNVVDMLGGSLKRLAGGDLMCAIDRPFPGELDRLRLDFNESLQHMSKTLADIRENALSIQHRTGELNQGANDLARRTEQQATSLEETAASINEMTGAVKTSSDRTRETDHLVSEILGDAARSAKVVTEAVGAMGRIEEASRQIEQIIGVIDTIAFQTNLLALNAGVEAARAGEAGKGFAVVAQEVRDLAQRSASAAKEIKVLIGHSGDEVRGGVRLVGETGDMIAAINTRIDHISRNVSEIARAAQEQATGLQEVNSAVTAMDQMTQQNAVMVQETNTSSHALALEAIGLNELVSQFRFAADGASHATQRAVA